MVLEKHLLNNHSEPIKKKIKGDGSRYDSAGAFGVQLWTMVGMADSGDATPDAWEQPDGLLEEDGRLNSAVRPAPASPPRGGSAGPRAIAQVAKCHPVYIPCTRMPRVRARAHRAGPVRGCSCAILGPSICPASLTRMGRELRAMPRHVRRARLAHARSTGLSAPARPALGPRARAPPVFVCAP